MTPSSLKHHPITTRRLDVGSHRTPPQYQFVHRHLHPPPPPPQVVHRPTSNQKADMLATNHGLKPSTGVLRNSAPKTKAQHNDLFINNPKRVTIPDFLL
uniref:Expressed protein n=1 Tax=Echinococcus granulosus TaxID=6210 RepID=A0A068W7A5_ECHGR|nr:expressed protein [Echinococcus granulosus]